MHGTFRTAEHVGDGHPDKYCDRVSDAILDKALDVAKAQGFREDSPDHPRHQRTAIETLAKDRLVIVSGEVKFGPQVASEIDVAALVREAWNDVGYPDSESVTAIDQVQMQSPELTVSAASGDAAGDQGIMEGYATDETPTFMPKEYQLSRDLAWTVRQTGKSGVLGWLRSDIKTQVTIDPGDRPFRVIIAAQHAAHFNGIKIEQRDIKDALMHHVVIPVLGTDIPEEMVIVNGTKSFIVGGTIGDCGLTGRKIVIDQYGPNIPVGGGAFSGKDPTKVDRSAAYAARQIAKTAVAMHIRGARTCLVKVAYCIGMSKPEMVTAVTDTGIDISDWVKSRFDLSPRAIIDRLGLLRNDERGDTWNYKMTSSFGHFGNDLFPWEQIANVSD